MTEINLLRWHQINNQARQKKQLRVFITIISAILFIFIISHLILNKLVCQSNHEALGLKNKLEIYQSTPLDGASNDLNLAVMEQLQFSQKQLWKMLDLLGCVSRSRIQVIKIALEEKQIKMSGLVDSAVTLTSSLEFCLSKDLAVNKMIFSHKNKTDFLQFSLVII